MPISKASFTLGPTNGASSERECESPPEPAPPEVPPRGPSLHVTLRHRPVQCEQPAEPDRLYLSEGRSSGIIGDIFKTPEFSK